MVKFCPKCGTQLESETSNFCPKCGNELNFNVKNQNGIGNYLNSNANEKHTAAIVIGYICSFLIPLIGIILGIYLLTRDNNDVHKHGIIMIVISLIIGIISILIFVSYLSYLSDLSYYSYYYDDYYY